MAQRSSIVVQGEPKIKEALAVAAITPGMLCEYTPSAATIRKHATGGGCAYAMFALEDENRGKGVTDDYSSANIVRVGVFTPGDEVVGLLAAGETAVVGSYFESNGDGYLRVVDTDASWGAVSVHSVIAQSREALDLASSHTGSHHIKIMII